MVKVAINKAEEPVVRICDLQPGELAQVIEGSYSGHYIVRSGRNVFTVYDLTDFNSGGWRDGSRINIKCRIMPRGFALTLTQE